MKRHAVVLYLLTLFGFGTTLQAQTAAANGTIQGLVSDPAGAPVADAAVRVRGLATGFERQASTSSEGRFVISLLPLGAYEVQVEAAGFAPYTQRGVTVEVGRAVELAVQLSLAATQQVVNVEADASIVRLEPAVTGSLTRDSVENLPLTSRNTQNLALFVPGLVGRRDDEFGTTQFAFGGMQRRGFMVDGVDNTQRGGQFRLGIFSAEAIQEISVTQNALAAEYGRTVGGIVNMVTRGGSNDFHGTLLWLARRPGLIARPSLARTKPFTQWGVYGVNASGPVVRDRVLFFANWEYQPIDAPRPITITPANASALGLPASELGSAPFAQRFRTSLGRLDFVLSPRHFGFVRYGYFYTPSKFNTSGGLLVRSAGNHFDDRQGSGVIQLSSLLSSRVVNELRVGDLFRRFWRPPVSGALGPVVVITGVAQLGSNPSAAQYYRERQIQVVDNLTVQLGKHNVKIGTDISTIGVLQRDRLAMTFTFANLASYLAGSYVNLVQQFGDNTADTRTNSYNFFAQDDYRITRQLTLSYGIRYEYLAYPRLDWNAPLPESRTINRDGNNFAPRFGLAWRPVSRTVVRGGYGLFYDTTNLRLISLALRNNGIRVRTFNVPGTNPSAPPFPAGFSAPPENPALAVTPSITAFAPDFRTMYAHQANLQLERELTDGFSLTLGYQFYGSRRGPLLADTNLVASGQMLADGRPVFGTARVNLRFNQINFLQSVANSHYHGLFLAANRRLSRGLTFTASYTLSKAMNTNDASGDAGTPVSDPTNFRFDYGPSSSDQRHRFVLQAIWKPTTNRQSSWAQVVNGWMIAPNLTWTSGFPVNVIAGTDLNRDGVNNDRPVGIPRNSLTGPRFRELNLRISRSFRLRPESISLELIAEAENLLNSTNAACGIGGCSGAVINRYLAPDFLRITSATNSRQIQLGARLRF